MGLTVAGVGVAGALVVGRLIRGLLFGVSPVDVTTDMATVGLVLGVALLTALLPAARAARTDPVEALAGEWGGAPKSAPPGTRPPDSLETAFDFACGVP